MTSSSNHQQLLLSQLFSSDLRLSSTYSLHSLLTSQKSFLWTYLTHEIRIYQEHYYTFFQARKSDSFPFLFCGFLFSFWGFLLAVANVRVIQIIFKFSYVFPSPRALLMDLKILSLVSLYVSYKKEITVVCSLVPVFISC